jgi:acyl transferase domain-containing protein/lauroyl/myristoyl acyltransferase/acyl carrier protein
MSALEPIAITGIGCRYPGGVTDAGSFWRLLTGGVDAITEIPADRWNIERFHTTRPGTRGRSVSKWGGFIDGIDQFDAAFFNISAREAACIDPQQRWLLLTAWEAIEDAGEDPRALRGSKAGVFVGVSSVEYCTIQASPERPGNVDVWTATGGLLSLASNRVSYVFDLHGPSFSVDTACSSSLIALHLACRSLRSGEVPLALVGGVNILLTPTPFISFSTAGMLSPDGRCKAFDASANGYVRAEGAAVVVLKPLSAARRDGDLIYAVIRGTAANEDGRNEGVTIPSSASQAALVREACRNAGVEPRHIQYVEAHGTGTPVGDPIEATALGQALGEGRPPTEPCLIGSVKTNIGHLETGAGLAGVIKAALTLHHGEIPPSLHCKEPNPRIDFDALKLRLVRETAAYRTDAPRLAGVNSFGFGGSNAHAVLEAAPAGAAAPGKPGGNAMQLLLLSAKSEESLRGLAGRYSQLLSEPDAPAAADICFTAAVHRMHHARRLAVVGRGPEELSRRLAEFAASGSAGACWEGEVPDKPAPPVFVFCGQGSQRPGMGLELHAEEPAFRESFDRCAAVYRNLAGWDLAAELQRQEDTSRLHLTEFAQPAIFAVQMGLVALLESWGVRPAALVGHSVGEVAAACASGALDLEAAARVVLERARSMNVMIPDGRMLSVGLPAVDVLEHLRRLGGRVSLGAVNSPKTVVLSGDSEPLEDLAAVFERRGAVVRWLPVQYAFHSHHVDGAHGPLLQALRSVRASGPRIPMVSTVHGGWAGGEDFDAGYWWANIRHPVLFGAAVRKLARTGHRLFLEIGPQSVLARPVMESLAAEKIRDARILASLRKDGGERAAMLEAAGRLHLEGLELDWRPVFAGARRVRLPRYHWQPSAHWREDPAWRASRLDAPPHPLLGRPLDGHATSWQAELGPGTEDYLQDHKVRGQAVMPAAAYIEAALAAAREVLGVAEHLQLEDVDLHKPFLLGSGGEGLSMRTMVRGTDWEIHSSGDGGGSWVAHAAGSLGLAARPPEETLDLDGLRRSMEPGPEAADTFARFAATGLEFGPAFQGGREFLVDPANKLAMARIELPVEADPRHLVHPAFLDACLQVLSQTLPRDTDTLFLPVRAGRVVFHGSPDPGAWCLAELEDFGPRMLRGRIRIADDSGRVLVEVAGFVCRAVGARNRVPPLSFYRWHWETGRGEKGRAVGLMEELREAAAEVPPMESRHHGELDLLAAAMVEQELAARSSPPAWAAALLDECRTLRGKTSPTPGGRAAAAFLAVRPQAWPELALLASAASNLGEALEGRRPPRSWTPAREAIAVRGSAGAAAAVLESFARRQRAGPPLSVMLLGADLACAAAHALAPALGPLSRVVVADADAKAASAIAARLPGARHAVWPEDSDIGFELVVADAEALTSVDDPARLKALLRPGGVLIVERRCPRGLYDRLLRVTQREPMDTVFEGATTLLESGGDVVAATERPAEADPSPTPAGNATRGWWLVFSDETGCGAEVARLLRDAGNGVALVRHGAEFSADGNEITVRDGESGDIERAIGEMRLRNKEPWGGVVHLWGLDVSPDWTDSATRGAYSLALLFRAVAASGATPRIILATRGARQVAGGETPDPRQAAIWGFGRVAMNEYPRLPCRLVDLDPELSPMDAAADLVAELSCADTEDETAWRGGSRHMARLLPEPAPATRMEGSAWQLAEPGAESPLRQTPCGDVQPGPGEIAIDVEAAGVNFRDALKSLGIYPANEEADFLLGDECSGRIVAVGSGVDSWQPGDEVMVLAPGTFASRIVVPAVMAARKPTGLDFAAAATIPVAFLTAWHALAVLGRLQPGETALIHAAAGGVGFAALQVARHLGARVIATAGSPEKRDFLRALGFADVLDSRGLSFAAEARALTGGRGVDLVLNSLAGEAIARGMAALAPHGRFIEIGKRDIYANTAVGLRPFRHGISFAAFDLGEVVRDQPQSARAMLGEISRLLETGVLRPLPHRVFPMDELPSALREMSQGRHIGKLVMVIAPATAGAPPPRFRPGVTYLITGGTRGFGLAVARWMAQNGARHLLLASRSGKIEDDEALEELRGLGASVLPLAADIARAEDVAGLLARIPADKPLAGVVHAAAVIEDATLQTLDSAKFARVLAGKALGARHLDEATRDMPLDHFILFSSVALTLGNPGQAAYSAANAMLAAVAEGRRARGRPALCLDWGAISGTGHASRQEGLLESLSKAGFDAVAPDEATGALAGLLVRGPGHCTVARIDWSRATALLATVRRSPRFAAMVDAAPTAEEDTGDLRESLRSLAPKERVEAISRQIVAMVARIVRTNAEKLPTAKPLQEIGFDSLMAIELINAVERRFDLSLPAATITSTVSVQSIAEALSGLMAEEDPAAAAASVSSTPAPPEPGNSGILPPSEEDEPDTVRPAARHRVEAAALRFAIRVFRGCDRPRAMHRLRTVLPAVRPFLANDRRWALKNLRAVFGDNLAPARRARLAEMALEHHLLSYVEGVGARGGTETFENHESALDAYASGSGLIVCGVHLGTWEPILRWGPGVGLPFAAVYRRAHNPLADRVFQDVRGAYGIRWVRSNDTPGMLNALADGCALGMMTDLNTFSGGVFADFLGLAASCPAGPAALALHTGARLVPAVALRESGDRTRIIFGEPLDPGADGVSGDNVRHLTRRLNAAFEPWILEYAEQYNWLHPRWRFRPDGSVWTLRTTEAEMAAARTTPYALPSERLLRVIASPARPC